MNVSAGNFCWFLSCMDPLCSHWQDNSGLPLNVGSLALLHPTAPTFSGTPSFFPCHPSWVTHPELPVPTSPCPFCLQNIFHPLASLHSASCLPWRRARNQTHSPRSGLYVLVTDGRKPVPKNNCNSNFSPQSWFADYHCANFPPQPTHTTNGLTTSSYNTVQEFQNFHLTVESCKLLKVTMSYHCWF